MTREELVEETGIDRISSKNERGDFELTEEFVDLVDDRTAELDELDEDGIEATLRTSIDPDRVDRLRDACLDDPELLGRFVALRDVLPDRSHEELLQLVIALDYFYRDPPRDDGSPSGFQPVYGDRLPFVLSVSEASIVYVWREDCDPCDLMKSELEAVVDSIPEHVGLYDVYGPAYRSVLEDEFSVVGGPTTLFCLYDTVDSRLVGASIPGVIEHEIEQIQ